MFRGYLHNAFFQDLALPLPYLLIFIFSLQEFGLAAPLLDKLYVPSIRLLIITV